MFPPLSSRLQLKVDDLSYESLKTELFSQLHQQRHRPALILIDYRLPQINFIINFPNHISRSQVCH